VNWLDGVQLGVQGTVFIGTYINSDQATAVIPNTSTDAHSYFDSTLSTFFTKTATGKWISCGQVLPQKMSPAFIDLRQDIQLDKPRYVTDSGVCELMFGVQQSRKYTSETIGAVDVNLVNAVTAVMSQKTFIEVLSCRYIALSTSSQV